MFIGYTKWGFLGNIVETSNIDEATKFFDASDVVKHYKKNYWTEANLYIIKVEQKIIFE